MLWFSNSGYLHVYVTAGDSWIYNRCSVCRWRQDVGITSDGCYVVYSDSFLNHKRVYLPGC